MCPSSPGPSRLTRRQDHPCPLHPPRPHAASLAPSPIPEAGAGYGLLTFHADDASEIIRIFDITWIG